MDLTNLRNRPLSSFNIDSMSESVLSLYHSLVTGSKDFPSIQCERTVLTSLVTTPFPKTENTRPSPQILEPAGMLVPAGAFRSVAPSILIPIHPEKIELGTLKADRRNRVLSMEFNGSSFTRVISSVYHTDSTELTNRWRVTDYSTDGHILMSVLCRFIYNTAQCAKTQREGKRKDREDESRSRSRNSSSVSPPKKPLRL